MVVQIPTYYGLPTGDKTNNSIRNNLCQPIFSTKSNVCRTKKDPTVWLNGIDCPSADGKKVVTDVEVEGPACKLKN